MVINHPPFVFTFQRIDLPHTCDALPETDEEKSITNETRRRSKKMSRFYLGEALQHPPELIILSREPDGKPHLRGLNPKFEFNLSHSGNWWALAFNREGIPIGFDIEDTEKKRDFEALRKRFFAPDEQTRSFCSTWTRKEAILKCLGLGIR